MKSNRLILKQERLKYHRSHKRMNEIIMRHTRAYSSQITRYR